MIKKLDIKDYENKEQLVWFGVINKINELCDIINTIQKEREAERFEIKEWIDILEAVRKSVNIHEKQIGKLQTTNTHIQNDLHEMRHSNIKTPAENVLTKSLRMDKEFAEEEMERLQKENKDLSDKIGKLETELDRTRKALDVTVDALKYANKCIKGGCVNWETEIDKALEQKDAK